MSVKKKLLKKQLSLFAVAIFLCTALITGNVLMFFSWGTGVAVNTLAAGSVQIRLLESDNSTNNYQTVGYEYDPLTEQFNLPYDYDNGDTFIGLSWTNVFKPGDETLTGYVNTIPKFARIENIGEGDVYLKVMVTFDFTDDNNLTPGENLEDIFNLLLQSNCPGVASLPYGAGFNPDFVYDPLDNVIAGNTYTATFYYVKSNDRAKLETVPNDGLQIQFLNGLFLDEDLTGMSTDNSDGSSGCLPLEVTIRVFAVQSYFNENYSSFSDAFKGHGF
jgi:hypothetical protein